MVWAVKATGSWLRMCCTSELLHLPKLQCLEHAVVLLRDLQQVCAHPGNPRTLGEHARYNVGIWVA